MVPGFVTRTGGSRWQSALPAGSRWGQALPAWTNFGGGLGEREAKRSLPQPGSAVPTRKTEEFGNSNLWFPNSCQNRRQQLGAGTACRQCRPSICGEIRRFEEISRSNQWRLVSCSVRRQQVGAGSACRQQAAVGSADRQQAAVGPADPTRKRRLYEQRAV